MSLPLYEKMKRGLVEKEIIAQRKERKERRERKMEEMAAKALEKKKKKKRIRAPPESMELSKTELERCFRAFEGVGAARTVERISELFRAVGEFVGEEELETIMQQVGWQEGQYFSMSQFVKGAEIIKQRVQGDSNRRPNDTEEAFVAIGGAEDMDGFINPTRLKEIVEEFELKLDVNNLMRTTLSGSEMMDFEDFNSIFSEAAIQEGEHLANEEAMETLRRKFAKADQRMALRSPTFKMKGKAFGMLVKDAIKDNKKEEDVRGESPTGGQKVEGGRRESTANSNSSPPLPASAAPMPLATSLSLTEGAGEESPLGVSMSLGTTLAMVDKETYLRKGVHSRLYPHSSAPTSTLPTLRSMLVSAAGELGVAPGVDFSRCDVKASRQRSRDKVKRDRSEPYSEARRPSIGIEAKLELQHVIKGAVDSSMVSASQSHPWGSRACTPASTFSTTTGRSEPSPVRNPFRQEIPMDFPFFTSTKGLPLLSPKEHEVVKQAQMDAYQSNLDLIEATQPPPPPKHLRQPGPRSRSSQSTRSYQPSRSHQGSSRPSTSLGVAKRNPSPSQRGVLSRTDTSIADTQASPPKRQLTDFLAACSPSPISLAEADISSLYLHTLAQHTTPGAEQPKKEKRVVREPAQPLPSRARLATESNLIVEELRSKAKRPEASKSVFRERPRRTTH